MPGCWQAQQPPSPAQRYVEGHAFWSFSAFPTTIHERCRFRDDVVFLVDAGRAVKTLPSEDAGVGPLPQVLSKGGVVLMFLMLLVNLK